MKNLIAYTLLAAIAATSVSLPALADDWHHGRYVGWHHGDPHRADWYFHPYWHNGRYITAPVPAPVVVPQPYYYGAYEPVPVVEPGISLNISR